MRIFVVAAAIAVALPARAEDRSQLNACKAMISAEDAKPQSARRDDAETRQCRQIIREWIYRDQRMIVDEEGRPLPLR